MSDTPTGRRGWRTAAALLALVGAARVGAADAYFVLGYHGGYYLTPEDEYRRCLDKLLGLLEADPKLRIVLELEPYTIEAMKHGERFEVERHGRTEPLVADWQFPASGVERRADAAHEGAFGVRLANRAAPYVNLCQPLAASALRNRTLTFSAWGRARSGSRVHLYLDAWSAQSFIPGSAVTAIAPPDGEWHRLSLRFTVPGDAVIIFPQAKIDGEGEGDFDALSVADEAGGELLQNGSFEQVSVPQLKDEARLAKLRQWCATGRLEIVGGAYTQPILYTIGDESAARQFVYGMEAVRESGLPVRVYAAQEPGLCGQLPQFARSCGLSEVLYRTHWCIFGSPPTRNAAVVSWVGPDGTRVPAAPAYDFTPLIGYGLPGYPTPGYLAAAQAAGVAAPLFTQFADLVATAIPDETASLTGGQVLSGWANLCRTLPAGDLVGRRLTLSAQLRATNPGGHLYIDAHLASNAAVGGLQTSNVPPDGQWHRAELPFTVPAGSVSIFPQARLIPPEGRLDVAELSLRCDDGRQLLPGPLVQGGRPAAGWASGGSEEVKVETAVGEQGGRQWVSLTAHGPAARAEVTTLGAYFDRVGAPQDSWPDAYRGSEHRFPWGLLAGRPQREDRLAEDAATGAERLLAIEGKRATRELDAIWRLVLLQQHHDGWVCAPVLFGLWRGYDSYGAMCAAAAAEARRRCAELTGPLTASRPGRAITVVNLTGHARTERADFRAQLPAGAARNPKVVDAAGRVAPGEVTVTAIHADGSAKEVSGRFVASAPSLGSSQYRLADREGAADESLAPRSELQLQPASEAEGLFSVPRLRGPVRLTGEWHARPAREAVVHRRDADATGLRTRGEVGGIKYECTAEASPTAPLVRVKLKLDFGAGAEVGATEDSDRLPKWARTDQKLRLVVPLPYAQPRFYAHEPFEVRPAAAGRAHCIRYAIAEGAGEGVALFSDRATDVFFRAEPAALELTLGYGGGFIYAPGERAPLTGQEEYDLALLFYRGDWASARVPELADDLAHPLLAVAGPEGAALRPSRVRVEPEGAAVVTALFPTEDGFAARLWRAYPGETDVRIHLAGARTISRADLAGHAQQRISTGDTVALHLRSNEIVTLAVQGE